MKFVGSTLESALAFLRDFASFAGRKGFYAAIFVTLGALFEGLGLLLIIPLLGIVVGTDLPHGPVQRVAAVLFDLLGAESTFWRLAALLGVFGALMLVRAIVISIRDVTLAELQLGFVENQRIRVTERLAASRWDQIVRLRHARITHLMSGDIQRIGAAAHFLLQCALAAVMLATQCILAFFLAPALAAMALGLLVVGAIALVPVLRRARNLGAYATEANLSLLDATSQFLGGLKLAISQNLQPRFVAGFRETLVQLTRRQIDYTRQQTHARLALTTLSALVGAALVLLGFGVFHTPAPVLIMLLLIVARMSGPAGQIQQGGQQLAHALPAYEKVKDLERELAATLGSEPAQGSRRALPNGPIVFTNVSFQHVAEDSQRESQRGVRGLNLTLSPGEFVGICGPSGAGKTTFADLLVGLFPPQDGAIFVGGVALDGTTLTSWREQVSYISQDPFLFHDTIRRNLAWANPKANEAQMWSALAQAGADDLVRRLESGLDTVMGERGTLVSGGERQRIALARALLRSPQLLVLDEATNAIDAAGERQLITHLLALTPRPIIVMIAHRAESTTLCERVLTLDGGRLASDRGSV